MKAFWKRGDEEIPRGNAETISEPGAYPAAESAESAESAEIGAFLAALDAIESRGAAAPVMERIARYEEVRRARNRRALEIGLCASLALLTAAMMLGMRLWFSGPGADWALAILLRLARAALEGLRGNAAAVALGAGSMTLMGIALIFREGKPHRR